MLLGSNASSGFKKPKVNGRKCLGIDGMYERFFIAFDELKNQ
jgi:hypothetical protein